MKASEAKQISEESRKISCDKIYSKIKTQCKLGDNTTQYDLGATEAKFADILIKELKENGFQVERVNGYDQRDDDSWDYLVISW